MMRKLTRNYSLSVVAPFFAILIVLTALAALAQVTGVGQQSAKPHAASPQQDIARDPYAPLFRPAVAYSSRGWKAESVAVADVNGDGKPDLVLANYCEKTCDNGSVVVLYGNGDGTFSGSGQAHNSGGHGAWSVAVADVNGDGKPDLLVTNYLSSTVGVLLSVNGYYFYPAVTYNSGGNIAVAVAVADVNGDGKPDLLVTNCGRISCGDGIGVVSVLLGNGDGTFQAAVSYDSGGYYAMSVAVADVNGDGWPDLLVTNDSGTVGVLLGNGNGTFQPVAIYGAGGAPASSVAVADVNGDGKPDVLVANWGALGVLLGNGDGTFQAAASYDPGGYLAMSVAVADVTGDGWPDLLVAECADSYCSGSGYGLVGVLRGNGDGTFRPAVTYRSGGIAAVSVAVADVNSDGWPDLLVANVNGCPACKAGKVGVLLNKPRPRRTETALTTSGSLSFVGQPVTFAATVTSVYALYGKIPDGELVMFNDGTTSMGSVALASGTAAFTTSSLSAKTHFIKATYAGDATFKPSTGWVKQVVDKYPTTTALRSSPNPSRYGRAVKFTAHVTSPGPNRPTGKVWFKDGTTGIGWVTLSGGVATVTKSKLAVGTHAITAQYLGDAASAKSTSSVLDQVVK
jgi:hypothetical protein